MSRETIEILSRHQRHACDAEERCAFCSKLLLLAGNREVGDVRRRRELARQRAVNRLVLLRVESGKVVEHAVADIDACLGRIKPLKWSSSAPPARHFHIGISLPLIQRSAELQDHMSSTLAFISQGRRGFDSMPRALIRRSD